MRAAIYGAGSLGTILGAFITRKGGEIDLVNRNVAHVKALREKGARVCGTMEFTQKVNAIIPDAMTGKYDIIFLMTKQQHNAEVVTFLKDFLADDGVIVTLQNGIPELQIGEIVGPERVLGCTVAWGATMLEPGVCELTSEPDSLTFSLGSLEKVPNKHLPEVKALLEMMGPVEVDSNFIGTRWSKLLINAAFSGMSAVLGCTFGEAAGDRRSRKYVQLLIKECIDVCATAGIRIEPVQGKDIVKLLDYNGPVKKQIAFLIIPIAIRKHAKLKASMLQDIEKGKKTEVDAINGVVCAFGRKVGCPTPVNDKVVEIIHRIENGELQASFNNLKLFYPQTIMRFHRILPAILACCLSAIGASAQEEFRPIAQKEAQVVTGKARFTILTPRLIRLEWAEDGVFEDRASLGIVNRDLPVPAFKVRRNARRTVITTDAVTLTYTGTGRFDENNLKVEFRMAAGKKTWHPGMDDSGNLLGTARTLDGFDYIRPKEYGQYTNDPFDKGVASRDGWALIDESGRHLFERTSSDWKYWVAERPGGDRIDWYLFTYGHDYIAAVSDFTKIAGKIPLPPKYALGYWWCRYWLYSDYELVDLARHFRDFDIPADVMIIDMDWHETWKMGGRPKSENRDPSGHSKGWTGYTWKKELFPNPAHLLEDLHLYGFKTSLNLHPASGIQNFEEPYRRFVRDYLSRTDDYDTVDPYSPFRIDQEAWADAYFNSVLHPMEKMGVDFWWLDWQQFRTSKYVKGLSNTFWLNYTFWNDIARRSASLGKDAPRPIIYHRWGGIGSHRYQLGFSGDTYATWRVLSYLPYFTSTAANVGYGYWGHDIGGHMQPEGVHETDPELYTRWLQNGVFMPIFKTHSTKDMSMEKRFWVFPDHFDPMREAIRLRYTLSPYIYNAARQAYDTGISICRPLYYYYPEDERAYSCREEYFFGDDIIATVLCEAADKTTGLTARKLWFPEGNDWYDVSTGKMYAGGLETTAHYTIDENPWYVRAGAIIPMASPTIKSLQESSNENWYLLVPGDGSSSATLYEDDGRSQAYGSDFATTQISREYADGRLLVKVNPRQGDFKGISPTRRIRIVLDGASAPSHVRVNGKELPYERHADFKAASGKYACWGYDGEELRVVIYLSEAPALTAFSIECDSRFAFTGGQKGLLKRMRSITPEAKTIFAEAVSSQLQLTPELLRFAGTASYITEDPLNAEKYLGELSKEALQADLAEYKLPQSFLDKLFAWTGVAD